MIKRLCVRVWRNETRSSGALHWCKMTLPKSGRRTITVDGKKYHYMIAFERSARAVIQSASGHGACLFVLPHAILKPGHVAEAIRFGQAQGWVPDKTGDDCWIAFHINAQDQARFEHIENDDFLVVTYATMGRVPDGIDPARFPDTRKWHERNRAKHDPPSPGRLGGD